MENFNITSLLKKMPAFIWLIIIFIIIFIFFSLSFISYYRRISKQLLAEKGKSTRSIDDFFIKAKGIFFRFMFLLLIFASFLSIITILYYSKIINYDYLIWILFFLILIFIILIIVFNQDIIKHVVDSSTKAINNFFRIIGILIILFFALIGLAYILGIKGLLEQIDILKEEILKKISKVIE